MGRCFWNQSWKPDLINKRPCSLFKVQFDRIIWRWSTNQCNFNLESRTSTFLSTASLVGDWKGKLSEWDFQKTSIYFSSIFKTRKRVESKISIIFVTPSKHKRGKETSSCRSIVLDMVRAQRPSVLVQQKLSLRVKRRDLKSAGHKGEKASG